MGNGEFRAKMGGAMTVHFLTGDDPSLLRAGVNKLLHEFVGGNDAALMVDEFDDEEYTAGAVADAAQTPPFLTDFRVVVARRIDRFTAADLAPLVNYLGDPLDSTHLILEWGSGRPPKALTDALKQLGVATVSTAAPSRPRDRGDWVAEQAAAAGVKLSRPAVALLAAHLGENASELDGILRTLVSTYGAGAAVDPDRLLPFLGDAGGVPPWDLTDAIDGRDTAKALGLLHRMAGAGGRHPLQLMAILQNHYGRLATLDGSGARSEAEVADVLGIKPGFPARKALDQSRRLGPDGTHRAVGLLADADLDLRGRTALEPLMVMEVLVARLSRLGGR